MTSKLHPYDPWSLVHVSIEQEKDIYSLCYMLVSLLYDE